MSERPTKRGGWHRSGERGAIGLIPAIIMLVIGGAAAVVTIVATQSGKQKAKPIEVFLDITDATATRDAQGRPHVHVKYRAAAAGEKSGPIIPEARVNCFVIEAGDRSRTFVGETTLFLADGATREGRLTITPPESLNEVKGEFRVRCEIARSGRSYFAATKRVTIPGPEGTLPDVADPQQYEGVYQVTFTQTVGIPLNCDPPTKKRTFTVKALTATTFSLELGGAGSSEALGISTFEATLTKTAQFSGPVYLTPPEAEWRGLLTGTFTNAGGLSVRGHFTRDDGHCEFDYIGVIANPTDKTFVITLEDIPDVDGCVAQLSSPTVAAGRITFKVTNNTFGFAQVFIYDAENNLAANNKKNVPERGGSVRMTATLVAGTYTVQCDGPGGEDKTVPLVVE